MASLPGDDVALIPVKFHRALRDVNDNLIALIRRSGKVVRPFEGENIFDVITPNARPSMSSRRPTIE